MEGSVTTAHDEERIREVRRQSRHLVTIGACATAGGIQALRNYSDVAGFLSAVYARPEYISTLATSTPISAHVKVDYELRGCPINKYQPVEVTVAFLAAQADGAPHSVFIECGEGSVSVMVAHGRAGRSRMRLRALARASIALLRLLRADGDAEHVAQPKKLAERRPTATSIASIALNADSEPFAGRPSAMAKRSRSKTSPASWRGGRSRSPSATTG